MNVGTDIITFYNPEFWGVETSEQISSVAAQSDAAFWTRIFDIATQSGLSGLELTFPPLDYRTAVAAFGSVPRLAEALSARGLAIWSSFFADLSRFPAADCAEQAESILAAVEEMSRFLASVGGRMIVVGLPNRTTWLTQPEGFVDFALAEPISRLLNRMGAVAALHGIALALHTEAHSLFCAPRDVDLFLLLTDPRYVHLCIDPAHIVLEGGDPVRLMARHLERVVAMHWKDASGAMPKDILIDPTIYARHGPYFRELGDGVVDFPALRSLLAAAPLCCDPIVEMDASADPVPVLQRAVSFVHRLTGAP